LNRDYFFSDADNEGKLRELELPLRVGGKKRADIVIPGVGENQLVAIIALADGHAFIQPAESPRIFFIKTNACTIRYG